MDQYALATPQDIQNITAVSASAYHFDDPIIKQCILTASSQIQRYCGRNFLRRQVSDIFNVPRSFVGAFKLYASAIPVVANTAEGSINGVAAGDALAVNNPDTGAMQISFTGSRLYNDVVRVNYMGGFIERENQVSWGEGFTNVKVLDCPPDIIQACGLQTSYLANRFLKNETGKKDGQNRAVGDRTSYSVIPEAAVILAAYVKPKMAGY